MKKLFISQPMNGKTEEEILAVRKKAIESAKVMLNEDVEVIESYFEDYNPDKGCVPLKYLAKSLELLADADVAYLLEIGRVQEVAVLKISVLLSMVLIR